MGLSDYLLNIDPDVHLDHVFTADSNYYTISEYENLNNSCSLRIINFNIRSYNANYDTFESFLNSITLKHDIIILTETWNTKETVDMCKIDGYNSFHTFRTESKGGGVSVFSLNTYQTNKIDHLSLCNFYFETCVTKLKVGQNLIFVIAIYRPPSLENIEIFFDYLETAISETNNFTVLTGDLNLNLLENGNHIARLKSIMNSFSLFPVINKPTRFPANIHLNNPSLIDHIWTNHSHTFKSGIIHLDITDHCPCFVHFRLNTTQTRPEKLKIVFRLKSRDNFNLFKRKISSIDWNSVVSGEDLNLSWNSFISKIDDEYCKAFPKKSKLVSTEKSRKPWITNHHIILIKQKSEYFKLYKLGIISKNVNNDFKNKINSILRNAKNRYFQDIFSSQNVNTRKKWKTVNYLMGRSRKETRFDSVLFENISYPPCEISEKFNDFFSSIARNLDLNLPPSNISPLSFMGQPNSRSMYLYPVTENECSHILQKLKLTGSHIDSINVSMLKKICMYITTPLVSLLNRSFLTGCFPEILKIARLTPVFKGGDISYSGNYRPISSLPLFSKIFERLFYNRILNFSVSYNLIDTSQFGFRRSLSTLDSLITLTENIYENLNKKKFHISVLLDLQKAFDTVNHDVLLEKLNHYGIRGLPLDLIRSYLTGRFHYTEIKNIKSSTKLVKLGVPQGSILAPLLFILYINDLPTLCQNLGIQLFADDTVISMSHQNFPDLVSQLNSQLELVNTWMISNRLTINATKTNVLLFSNRPLTLEPIFIANTELKYLDSCKFLGVTLDTKLNFRVHIDYVISKISKSCGVLYRIRKCLPLKSRIDFYYAFIYPFLIYCVTIWGGTYQSYLDPLFIIQKKVIRIIAEIGYNDHTSKYFRMYNLLKFFDIFKFNISIYMYKNLEKYQKCHPRNTRSKADVVSKFHRLTLTQHSVSFLGPKIWNNLPNSIQTAKSLPIFKDKLKKYFISFYE